uniref:Uncharacterized protein n=1 Tax=Fagus sylvatica TaxID=28930 RepID=A0A2N9J3N0_FAGSY
MAIIGDALRQAFMPKHEYECLRDEDKAWGKLQRPLIVSLMALISLTVIICTVISLNIVFPASNGKRPFCSDERLQPLIINNVKGRGDSDHFPGAYYLTDQETVDYYWMVVFLPSIIIFFVSLVYLVAGITVAYSAPTRHGCLIVVENNYCASKRGGVRCLSVLNVCSAIIFGLLALSLGSTLLTLGNSCAVPLFWCYEITSWGLVILYGGTAFFLKRKAVVLDQRDFRARNLGLEMLETNPLEVTPEVERRVNEGFKAWMGSSLLSSDEEVSSNEDENGSYQEVPHIMCTNSNIQRV